MSKLQIMGGNPLDGTIKASGAKNAMTKLLVASLISDKKCIFSNVPNISDVQITVDLCKEIGMQINWDKEKKIMEVQTLQLNSCYVPQRFCGANRIPILLIGALLGRTSEDIIVPTLGGDLLGSRPLDFHIQALQKLGATIEYRNMKKEGAYFAQAHQGLIGSFIELPYPSVGATENALLAATSAEGITLIKNAAIEPEVIDLILFLQKMGANISLEAKRVIRVEKIEKFQEVYHSVIPDRNEVISYACAAISTKGKVLIENAKQRDLIAFLSAIRKIGGNFTIHKNGIEFFASNTLNGNLHIETDVHPGFMTDWQPPFGVLLTQNDGTSIIHETVYENRFGYAQILKEMGASIDLFSSCLGEKKCRFASKNHPHSIVIHGPTPLVAKDKEIIVPDLRAGFAYVIAALLCKDTTLISGANFLDRGYEDMVEKLQTLGADISRVEMSKKKLEKTLSSLDNKPEQEKV